LHSPFNLRTSALATHHSRRLSSKLTFGKGSCFTRGRGHRRGAIFSRAVVCIAVDGRSILTRIARRWIIAGIAIGIHIYDLSLRSRCGAAAAIGVLVANYLHQRWRFARVDRHAQSSAL